MAKKDSLLSGGGYKNPPPHTRFPKGTSGNPRGRPKGSKNLKTELLEELSEKIPLTLNGKRQKISKQRIAIKNLVAQAMNGNVTAATKVFDLSLKLTANDEPERHEGELSQNDKEILAAFIKRYGEKL